MLVEQDEVVCNLATVLQASTRLCGFYDQIPTRNCVDGCIMCVSLFLIKRDLKIVAARS